ncbi:MAG: hypothetical protein SCALA701_35470 [Candidatus Scalindua sp.]|nr:hypothetical protein [Planctomycetota bacterium]RZV91343.1 MAG: hypothetical protein EX341_05265 [Candidatus Scalindua sp. SCAELEC01]GJQ60746.1 MAG: hypothetical protein SCALA701_35470 [Candidatus Scalindua sp.]
MKSTQHSGRIIGQMFLIGFFIVLLNSLNSVYATHLRFLRLEYEPGVNKKEIHFKVPAAFRRNGFGGTHPDGHPQTGDVITETIGGTGLNFGDGSYTGTLDFLVTSFDVDNNWIFCEALDPADPHNTFIPHTYTNCGNVSPFIQDCCRISGFVSPNRHINNPNGLYRAETVVDVCSGDSSPIVTLPPIVTCKPNAVCNFTVNALDPDGDPINWLLSTSHEASGGSSFTQPGPPDAPNAASIDPLTGIYTWDTTGATLAGNPLNNTLYSTQVTVEHKKSGDVKSKTPVDFFIQIGKCNPGTDQPPVFDPPPASRFPCGTTRFIEVGQTLVFDIQASDPDDASVDMITLNVVDLPVGASMNPPLPHGPQASPVKSTFSWTATRKDSGAHAMTFSVIDDCGNQDLCNMTIKVVTILNSCLAGVPDKSTYHYDDTPVPDGPAGTFSFDADFCNICTTTFSELKSITTELMRNNVLSNRNPGKLKRVGSELTFLKTGDYADGELSPGECVRVHYVIGLTKDKWFRFFCDVVGVEK